MIVSGIGRHLLEKGAAGSQQQAEDFHDSRKPTHKAAYADQC